MKLGIEISLIGYSILYSRNALMATGRGKTVPMATGLKIWNWRKSSCPKICPNFWWSRLKCWERETKEEEGTTQSFWVAACSILNIFFFLLLLLLQLSKLSAGQRNAIHSHEKRQKVSSVWGLNLSEQQTDRQTYLLLFSALHPDL